MFVEEIGFSKVFNIKSLILCDVVYINKFLLIYFMVGFFFQNFLRYAVAIVKSTNL